jgi:PAS domain S-box-containing protein
MIEQSRRFVFGKQYDDDKQHIMQAIDETLRLVSTRMQHEMRLAETELARWQLIFFVLGLMLPVLSAILIIQVRNQYRREHTTGEALEVELKQRQKAEQEVLEKNRRLGRLNDMLKIATESAAIGIWSWDIIQNTLKWDEMMYRLYGREKSDQVEPYKLWFESVHPDDQDQVESILKEAVQTHNTFNAEFRVVWPNGSVIWMQGLGRVQFDDQGQAVQMIGANRDITQEKEYISNLEQARLEADSANRKKSEFLANMSHEIRTPMNAVIGLTQLMLETELSERQLNYLNKVLDSSRSLLDILNEILDYSKIEAGKLELEFVEFKLDDILLSTANLFAISAEEKGLELIFDIDPAVATTLIGDVVRLRQIMNNLVGNALKFSDEGYVHVSVTAKPIDEKQLELAILVEDTGIGMSPEQVSRLFQAFEQADTSTTRKFGGTGLGLAICKKLVEMMGGRIQATSGLGKGSCFSVNIPFGIAELSRQQPDISKKVQPMHTLILDSHKKSAEAILRIFKSWSIPAESVDTSQGALNAIYQANEQGDPFELFIIDWGLPNIDSRALIEEIRQWESSLPVTSTLSIVVMAAYQEKEKLDAYRNALNLDAIITKPILPSTLFNTLVDLKLPVNRNVGISDQTDLQYHYQALAGIRGASILLVEDNQTNQMVGREYLETLGMEVEVASHGAEAVEKVQKGHYECILMDLQMPVMDGLEATKKIRLLGNTTPIVALTAAAMQEDKHRSVVAGMDDFLSKPINIDELATVLLRCLDGKVSKPKEQQASILPQPTENTALHSKAPFQIEGLDLKVAVQRMGNNWQLLGRTLHLFTEDFANCLQQLDEHIANEEWKKAHRIVHSIKGLALTIGATRLNELSIQFEQNVKIKRSEGYDLFAKELASVLNRIKLFFSQTENSHSMEPKQSMPKETIQRLILQLEKQLAHSEFILPELLDELKKVFNTTSSIDLLKQLNDQIERFDYAEAQKTLAVLKQALPLEEE